jgi:hypothetical protein
MSRSMWVQFWMFLERKLMVELLVRVVDVAIGWMVWCMTVVIRWLGWCMRGEERVDVWG